MKRSEILQHIREDLEDKLGMLSRGKFDYVAEEILDMLEGFGMLPPESSHFEHFDCEDDEGSFWTSRQIINSCHTWEPEGEKK